MTSQLFLRLIVGIVVCLLTAPLEGGVRFRIDDNTELELGWFIQGWYQFTGREGQDHGVHDFTLRRNYISLGGEFSKWLGGFVHIASDRLGQDGLNQPSLGLGSGVAFRDAWVVVRLHDALNLQLGRMYVPLTRSFGTTGTKAMLTTDLPFLQGGIRGNIFYTNKAGRDDGLAVWGNPLNGLIHYRLMIAEGVEGAGNPADRPRFAGRVAINLLEPERTWFNRGTYLGEKKVLALGFGADCQSQLLLGQPEKADARTWTVDFFLDHPLDGGAITLEASYSDIHNSAQSHNLSDLSIGDDARTGYIQGGYLVPGKLGPGRLQPYLKTESISVNAGHATNYHSAGLNYYLRGHDGKLSFDYSFIDQPGGVRPDQPAVTVQLTVGF